MAGISRSKSELTDHRYSHYQSDVQDANFKKILVTAINNLETLDLCVYCVGIGDLFNASDLKNEIPTINVNFIAAVQTISVVLPVMLINKKGHFIGLSSVADEMISAEAPSYHASKAGLSNYLEGLALAMKPKGIFITNVRFGFVDTKMAKGDVKPFMMSVEKATDHLQKCIDKKPGRYTAPKIVIPLGKFRNFMLRRYL